MAGNPKHWRPKSEAPLEPWMCGATRRDGKPCRMRKVKGRDRCRMHGGKHQRGAEHANTTHGRYSMLMPTSFGERAKLLAEDAQRNSLALEIDLVTAEIGQLIEQTEAGDPRQVLKKIQQHIDQATKILVKFGTAKLKPQAGKQALAAELLGIRTALESAIGVQAVMDRIGTLIDRRARLTRNEWQRELAAAYVITPQQDRVKNDAISQAIRRNVTDPEIRAAIARDLVGILD